MAVRTQIFKTYVFGKLPAGGSIKYFTPTNGYLVYRDSDGNYRKIKYPTEAQMNDAGWYRVVNVAEDGTDYINDNILYHYTGVVEEEPIEEEEEE